MKKADSPQPDTGTTVQSTATSRLATRIRNVGFKAYFKIEDA